MLQIHTCLCSLLGYDDLEVINPEGGTKDVDVEAQRGRWNQELMEYSHLLELANECEDPYMRLVYTTSWFISLYYALQRTWKPFNPTLGETYEMVNHEDFAHVVQPGHCITLLVVIPSYKCEDKNDIWIAIWSSGSKGQTNSCYLGLFQLYHECPKLSSLILNDQFKAFVSSQPTTILDPTQKKQQVLLYFFYNHQHGHAFIFPFNQHLVVEAAYASFRPGSSKRLLEHQMVWVVVLQVPQFSHC
ncbi:unnamed protein product [Lactuca saligna]|uniref:Uncharacterized protein n=1 Tax=Lactuca saligna TaxID=75948 RepID=A0AA35VL38_LACSI|nr:unnamed protein product [Lactuca saligna]